MAIVVFPLKHQVSFCGYFPADNPQYSCIVVIFGPKTGYASGGKMAGSVFKEIAERVYARNAERDIRNIKTDTSKIKIPVSKNGSWNELETVFSEFDIDTKGKAGQHDWVRTSTMKEDVRIQTIDTNNHFIPNVKGMGAKDAVYLIENIGMKVKLLGKGSVHQQSIIPGTRAVKGATITLTLK